MFRKGKSLLFLIIFYFILTNGIYATKVLVNVTETSTLTKLVGGSYSIKAQGTLEIKNPSLVSKVYDVIIPLDLDSLIGINKISIDNSSNSFEFNSEEIKGYIINPNSSIKVGYEIFGLLSYDLYSVMASNQTVFEYYTSSYDFSSSTILNLQKPTQENTSVVNSSRLISAGIRNPTDFDYFAKDLTVYKTDVANPFFDDGEVLASVYNISIDPFGFQEFDFFDRTSRNDSVYWISSNVLINHNDFYTFDRNLVYQQEQIKSEGGGGGSGFDSPFGALDKLNSLFIKKDVSSNLIRLNEPFEVTLRIVNVNNFKLKNVTVFDEIPNGYDILNMSERVKINEGGKIEFNIKNIDEYDTYVIKYKLVNTNEIRGITYLKPAILHYDENDYFSDGVLLVNELLSKKKIFIQKEIDNYDEEFARVTIKVKNLGAIRVENILITDFIEPNLILKEISKTFHDGRGVWKIKSLNAGEEWEVSYLVEKNSQLDYLPNVFGVDKSEVFGTIISSGEVTLVYGEEPRTIERVGIGLAAFLLVIYLLF